MMFLSELELAERALLRKGNPTEEQARAEFEEVIEEWDDNFDSDNTHA